MTKEIMRERRGLVEEEQVNRRVVITPVKGKVNDRGVPYAFETCYDEQGQPVMEEERRIVQRLCKAHRVRYSKQFFPTSTAELRRQLFGEKPEVQESESQNEASTDESTGQEQKEAHSQEQSARPAWMLYEVISPVSENKEIRESAHKVVAEKQYEKLGLEPDIEESETRAQRYRRMHREALLETLEQLRAGKRLYSRRIIGIWNFQRERLRMAG